MCTAAAHLAEWVEAELAFDMGLALATPQEDLLNPSLVQALELGSQRSQLILLLAC